MPEDNNTDPNADIAKKLSDALDAQTERFEKLLAQAGTSNIDESVLKGAGDALAEAKKIAAEAFKARDEAKAEARTADERIDAMAAQLRRSEVTAVAAAAGALNPGLVAGMVAADADPDKTITALKESDAYLFGQPGQTQTQPTVTTQPGLDLGQTNTGAPDPYANDEGLKGFGEEIARIAGIGQ